MTTRFRKSSSSHGPDFFRYEAAGLRWLADSEGAGGPRVVRVLEVDDDSITLERIESARPSTGAAEEFGRALAAMHDAPEAAGVRDSAGSSSATGSSSAAGAAWGAPPPGWGGRCFIGNRSQECRPTESWGEFYAEQRVRPFVRVAVDLGALGGSELAVVERAMERVASGELDDDDRPARIHGDLWAGNVMWTAPGVVLIDPAAHLGHRETDLAMLALFGAPHLERILAAYDEAHPLRSGWRERVALHQLHPLATHSAGHGPGYAVALAEAARATLRL